MNFSNQMVSLLLNLSLIGWILVAFVLPSGVGRPIHFSLKMLWSNYKLDDVRLGFFQASIAKQDRTFGWVYELPQSNFKDT
jgi:hypothetical protein